MIRIFAYDPIQLLPYSFSLKKIACERLNANLALCQKIFKGKTKIIKQAGAVLFKYRELFTNLVDKG
jgi:hypothetical protein